MIKIKKYNTQVRLKQVMEERKLRQIDILNLVKPYCLKYDIKFNKSDLSQYLSGKTVPNQDKLAMLAMALNVNESWLAGFDVPMPRKDFSAERAEKDFQLIDLISYLTEEEQQFVYDVIYTILKRKGINPPSPTF